MIIFRFSNWDKMVNRLLRRSLLAAVFLTNIYHDTTTLIKLLPSNMLHRVVWCKPIYFTDILATPDSSYSSNGGSRHQWNDRRKQTSLAVCAMSTSYITIFFYDCIKQHHQPNSENLEISVCQGIRQQFLLIWSNAT